MWFSVVSAATGGATLSQVWRMIGSVDRFILWVWRTGVRRPALYEGPGVADWNVFHALERGYAVALGATDDITAECERCEARDPTVDRLGQRRITWRLEDAQEQAWAAWRRSAPAAVLEIADALARGWTLGRAALAETAELLDETNPEAAA
jgi:hypothetical protein